MTYLQLKNMIADTLNRQDLTSVIPSFITLAEADIARKVKHWKQEKRVTLSLDESHETVPSDWIETINMYLEDGSPVLFTPIAEISRQKLRHPANGKPSMYTINAGEFEFYPVPNQAYNLTMVYRARTPELSVDGDTNWILNDYPDVYLYSALLHTAPYLKDDERVTLWAGLKESAIMSLNQESQAGKYSGTPLKMRIK